MTIKTRSHIHVFGSLLSLVSPLTVVTIVVIGLGLLVTFDETIAQTQQQQGIQEWHTGRDLDLFNQASISANWTTAKRRERLLNFAKKQKILRLNPSIFGFKTLLIQHDRYNASRFHDAPIFHDSLIFCNNVNRIFQL